MKIRIKFRKYGALKFVGHLDMMRYFQKALKRAGIDMKYSEGFNPHMIMSFAAPLGVGITSDGEYFDIEVLSTKSTAESLKVLNEAMVEGVEVTSYVALPDTAKKSMSLVAAADYEIFFSDRSLLEVTRKGASKGAMVARLAERLGISAEQLAYVTNSEPGHGLLFFNNVILPFADDFPKDTELYKLLTTKPSEVEH